ncbi:MAG: phosphoribosylglycinamide formyltransferase [Sutterellaceae bacterium]|nr:phosphoribosylglycinamide formyltransferase [Burkholderiaceae bacterium]MCX7900801.1 phosphoribosylglycinamide formyltransferase [Burkholderiaceae bacterium]MDW8430492.1 phosphoribosylglycinamide formyltransferase [Sutterellaceae bacterium]
MKRVVVLISGRGSNLQALLRAARIERWRETLNADIVHVISNRPQAPGLAVAREAGVSTEVVDHRAFPSRAAFDAALATAIEAHAPFLVVLAGFMRVLTRDFVQRFNGRLINIHPSLLPAFPGLATHRQALAAGVRFHGATVHFVSVELDGGPIIGQAVVPVRLDDTEESLAARVLQAEHRLLPTCVRLLLEGRVRLQADRVAADVDVAQQLALAAL